MTKIFTTLTALLVSMLAFAQPSMPTVSTSGNEVYYYIQMQRGQAVITSMGNGSKVQTATPVANMKKQQTWKIEKQGDSYRFVNAAGQTLYYNTSLKFFCAGTQPNGILDLKILKTTNKEYQGFEISTTGSGQTFLNQWGGAGVGHELGLWVQGDPNNPLQFVAINDMVINDAKPTPINEVSLTGSTTWKPTNKHTLWYTKPATVWMTSTLPIGNGQFGGCVMGGVKRDEVQLNDKTLWKGHVGAVVGNPNYGSYLNFGNLYIT